MTVRDEFRESVFKRDQYKCVMCGSPAQDAHHIMERRLFSHGGYMIDNGASLCGPCHILAEQTVYSCEQIRDKAGIKSVVLPEHLYSDQLYTKWGDPILDNGMRLKGELFQDESVQKILKEGGKLHLYTDKVKYPRTYHVPWSGGIDHDERVIESFDYMNDKEIIVTIKMDGENTTMANNYIHARSIEYSPHPSRNMIKILHSSIAHEIPPGWRICGENLTAVHSIKYNHLPSIFLIFSIWNEQNICLPWDETVEWAQLLELKTVPVVDRFIFNMDKLKSITEEAGHWNGDENEGYVIRIADSFHYRDFKKSVAKMVRPHHLHTHGQWTRQKIEFNKVELNENNH